MAFFDKLGDFATGFVQGAAQSMPAHWETQRREARRDEELAENRRRQDRNDLFNTTIQSNSPEALQMLYDADPDYGEQAAAMMAERERVKIREYAETQDQITNRFNSYMLSNPSYQEWDEANVIAGDLDKLNLYRGRQDTSWRNLNRYSEIVGQDYIGDMTQPLYSEADVDEFNELISGRKRAILDSNLTEGQAAELIRRGQEMKDTALIDRGYDMLRLTQQGSKFQGKWVPLGHYSDAYIKQGMDSERIHIKNQQLLDIAAIDPYRAEEMLERSASDGVPYNRHVIDRVGALVGIKDSGKDDQWIEKLLSDNQFEAAMDYVTQEELSPSMARQQGRWVTRILDLEDNWNDTRMDAGFRAFRQEVSSEYDKLAGREWNNLTQDFIHAGGEARHATEKPATYRQAKMNVIQRFHNSLSRTERDIAARVALQGMAQGYHGSPSQAIANKIIIDVRSMMEEKGLDPDEEGIAAVSEPVDGFQPSSMELTPEQEVKNEIESWQDKVRSIRGMSMQERQEVLNILEATYGERFGIEAGYSFMRKEDPTTLQQVEIETMLGPKFLGNYLRGDLPYQSSRIQQVNLANWMEEKSTSLISRDTRGMDDSEKNDAKREILEGLMSSVRYGVMPYNTDIKKVSDDIWEAVMGAEQVPLKAKAAKFEEVADPGMEVDIFAGVDDAAGDAMEADPTAKQLGAGGYTWRKEERDSMLNEGLPAQERFLKQEEDKYKREYIDKGEYNEKTEEYLEGLRGNIERTKERILQLEDELNLPAGQRSNFEGIIADQPRLPGNIAKVLGNVQTRGARGGGATEVSDATQGGNRYPVRYQPELGR